MHRTATFATVVLGLAGCAASPPDLPDAATLPDPVPVAQADASTAENATTDPQVIEVVDVPDVPETTHVPGRRAGSNRVCRNERRTGTNRVVRVCRSLSEIESETVRSKRTFEELRRSQREYDY